MKPYETCHSGHIAEYVNGAEFRRPFPNTSVKTLTGDQKIVIVLQNRKDFVVRSEQLLKTLNNSKKPGKYMFFCRNIRLTRTTDGIKCTTWKYKW